MFKFVLGALCILGMSLPAFAQVTPDASPANNVSFFSGVTTLQPDYGGHRLPAFVLGANVTHHFDHFYLDPSVEVRGIISLGGQSVSENFFAGGMRLERAYRRFVPYADILAGKGFIQFRNKSATIGSDNSAIITYGAGGEFRFNSNIGLFGEYERENWNLGESITLTPYTITAGLLFHYR